LSES